MTNFYTAWHLNLGFSALETHEHKSVIDKSYWPLLELAESDDNRFGIEMSASTLKRINELDPMWVKQARNLQDVGKIEILASGWSQIISPLVPWQVTEKNLAYGMEYYYSIFRKKPKIAFINEQAWSDGLFDLYVDAGFEGVIIEWENSISANPDWNPNLRFTPVELQKDGRTLAIIWNHSSAFQKLQRLAHNEISLNDWKNWYSTKIGESISNSYCIYGGDTETIGYRPKRYAYESEALVGEWDTIKLAFAEQVKKGNKFKLPSELLSESKPLPVINSISTLDTPIPTKKQPKYNPLRWAVGGRDSVQANTRCQAIFDLFTSDNREQKDLWLELLELWASDYRTHITQTRWEDWQSRIETLENKIGLESIPQSSNKIAGFFQNFHIREDVYEIEISNADLKIILDKRKGLAVKELSFYSISSDWLIGTFTHGNEVDVAWNADFFTGEFVFEPPGQSKISDLIPVSPRIDIRSNHITVSAEVESRLGILEKCIRIEGNPAKIELTYIPHWDYLPAGSLRFGDVVLNPKAFKLSDLQFKTHNGGKKMESYKFTGVGVEQGRALSALVSSKQCFGLTQGFCLVGDLEKQIKISNVHTLSKTPAILTYQKFRDSFLFRLQFSGRELDDTSFQHQLLLKDRPMVYQITIEPSREQHD